MTLLAGLWLGVLSGRAEAKINCARAGTPAEHMICASPALRQVDDAINGYYATVIAAAQGALPAALRANEKKFLAARDKSCGDTACLLRVEQQRRDALAALAARVSDDNPSLLDLTATWFSGTWRAGPVVPPDLHPTDEMQDPGTVWTFHAGELCRSQSCLGFGLEKQKQVTGLRDQDLATSLHLPPQAAYYVAYVNGRAGISWVALPDGTLMTVSPGCAKAGDSCRWVSQTWQKQGSGATVDSVDLGAP